MSLEEKIGVTQARIMEWYMRNDKQCYVSFSGGKDSTVLAYIAAQVCDLFQCKLVLWFSDTGLEFPEVKEHVKTFENYLKCKFPDLEVETIIDYPKDKNNKRITFRDVILKYGYPLISKDVAEKIYKYRSKPSGYTKERFDQNSEYCKKYGKSFCLEKWIPLRDSDIPISARCCDVMKKKPAKDFEKSTLLKPIVGTMASESRMRKQSWLKQGCNAFDAIRPISKPLSFWSEQNILEFIIRLKLRT